MGNIWSSGVKRNGIKWSGGQGKKEQPGNQDRNTCSCLSTIKEVKTVNLDNKLDLGCKWNTVSCMARQNKPARMQGDKIL